jgi:5-formyltetrahydrofolate cyclo-ligase
VDPNGPLTPVAARKLALRDQLSTVRRRRSLSEVAAAARELADRLLEVPEVRRAATVAAYVSIGTEPGTGPLLDRLRSLGRRVVLPVLLPDFDLDWAAYDGPGALVRAGRGLLEPAGRRLGPEAVGTADVVLVPATAVDRAGNRLGKGGGSYDRALGRVPVGTLVCALLYDGELVEEVPVDAHDRPVTAVLTPSGLTRLPTV